MWKLCKAEFHCTFSHLFDRCSCGEACQDSSWLVLIMMMVVFCSTVQQRMSKYKYIIKPELILQESAFWESAALCDMQCIGTITQHLAINPHTCYLWSFWTMWKECALQIQGATLRPVQLSGTSKNAIWTDKLPSWAAWQDRLNFSNIVMTISTFLAFMWRKTTEFQ